MSKPRIVLALISGVLLAGLGVGALAHVASRGASETARPVASSSFVPESAGLVGFVDVRALAASPLYDLVAARRAASDGEDPFAHIREELDIDPRKDVASATFSIERDEMASADTPPGSRWGWAVRGDFDAKALEKRVAAREGVHSEDYEGMKLYVFDGGSGQSLALAVPEADVFVFGEPDYVRRMIDAGAASSGATVEAVAEWKDVFSPSDTFWLAGEPPERLGGLASASPAGVASRLPSLASFVLSGRLSESLALVAQARSVEPAGARSLAELVRGLLALGRLNASMGPDLANVLETVRIDQADDRVAVSLEAPFDVVQRLLDSRRDEGGAP